MGSKGTLTGVLALWASMAAYAVPVIYIAGDSTAKNGVARGWGDHLAGHFDASKVKVDNRARAGRSSRTFLTEGLWDGIVSDLQPGDFVLIQFGHNDGGPLETGRARGSIPGIGYETRELTPASSAIEIVHTYGWYLRRFIADTKEHGATPVVLSLTVRNIWRDGKVERGSGQFNDWARAVAESEGVSFADVTAVIADRYERLGETAVKGFFPEDHTHTTDEGAELNDACVVAALKQLRGNPFGPLLSAKGVEAGRSSSGQVVLIGDSTVRNGQGDGRNGQWGWGEPLVDLLAPVPVLNRAKGGRSSRSFFTSADWEGALANLHAGDVLVMQFGHNDSGPLDDAARARGTLPGIGDETREIDNPLTGKHEVVHTYGWYLRQYIHAAQSAGAVPVVCSPIPRKIWKDGKIERSRYAGWAREVAASEGVRFIDLESLIAARYEQMGPAAVEAMFAGEHTHTSRAGAELNAGVVSEQLRPVLEGKK